MAQALAALGIDPRVLILQIIAFVALYLVLKRYLFGPLMTTMAGRASEVVEGMEAARKSKEFLAHVEEERERLLSEARDQGRERVRQAVREAEKAREQILAEAREEAQHIRARGREVIELEREQALMEVRRVVVDLALMAASRAVLQRMDEKAHRQAVEEFLASLEEAQ